MNNTRKRLARIFACALTGVLLSAGVTACGKKENYRSIFATPDYAVNALAFEEMNTYEGVKLKLYFANETGDGLVEVIKPVEYNSNISMEKLVVEYLVKGPDTEDAFPVINPATKILGVTVKDGICYVNVDENFMTQIYNVTADVVIYSIVNSLVELSNVNKVQIAVNGKTDIVFRETFNLVNLYERNLELIKTGENQK